MAEFIRSLDAFPKVDTECLERTRRGGFTTIAVYSILVVLGLVEVFKYCLPPMRQMFVVDPALGKFIPLTIDVSVATPCDQLVVLLTQEDGSNIILDSLLEAASEGKRPGWLSANTDPNIVDTCRIRGTVPISRTKGVISIVPLLAGAGGLGAMILAAEDSINFSHHIHRIAFGGSSARSQDEIHGDPLAATTQHKMSAHEQYTYFCSVISSYRLQGESFDHLMSGTWANRGQQKHLLSTPSHQYAINGFLGKQSPNPALIFKYDYEPLAIVMAPDRSTFRAFLVRIIGILGGIYTSVFMLHFLLSKIAKWTRMFASKLWWGSPSAPTLGPRTKWGSQRDAQDEGSRLIGGNEGGEPSLAPPSPGRII